MSGIGFDLTERVSGGKTKTLVDAQSTTLSGKKWLAVDLGAGEDVDDWDYLCICHKYNTGSVNRYGNCIVSVADLQALSTNALDNTNWYASTQDGISYWADALVKMVVGKRSNGRYIAVACDRHDSQNTVIDLTVRGIKI